MSEAEPEAIDVVVKRNKRTDPAQALLNEAIANAIEHRRTPIGKLHTHYYSDGDSDRTVRVDSATKERTFLIVAQEAKPVAIAGGRYRLSELTTVTGKDGVSGKQHHFACMCSVPVDSTFTAMVQFPDAYALFAESSAPTDLHSSDINKLLMSDATIDSAGAERAKETCAMWSSDPYLGHVKLSIEFGVSDPELFVGVLQDAHSNAPVGKSEEDGRTFRTQREAFEARFRDQLDSDPTLKISRPGMIGRIIDLVKGKQELVDSRLLEPTMTITFADIYPALRFELMRAISTAVVDYRAEDMTRNSEQRDKLETSIVHYMSRTLAKVGLCVKRVAEFQFLSDDFTKIQRLSAEVATEDEINTLLVKRLENGRKLVEAQRLADIFKLQNELAVDKVKTLNDNQIKDLELDGSLDRTKKVEDAKRDAKAKDAEQDLRLRFDEIKYARAMLELYRDAKAIQFEDSKRRLDYYKDLPPDQMFLLLLNENPALRDAFVASQQAKSVEDRVAAERAMRGELLKLQDTHGNVLKELLVVGAQQVGQVAQKAMEGRRDLPDGQIIDAKP